MATQESRAAWAACWRKTAADYRDIGYFEERAARCVNLPKRVREQSERAARKAFADAADCESYAENGTRF
jgi:hypothetical protein